MTDDQLRGWKDIAAFLQTSARTVQRWERDLGMPVHRIGPETRRMVYALQHELVAWRKSKAGRVAVQEAEHFAALGAQSPDDADGDADDRADGDEAAASEFERVVAPEALGSSAIAAAGEAAPRRTRRRLVWAGVATLVIATTAVGASFAWKRLSSPTSPSSTASPAAPALAPANILLRLTWPNGTTRIGVLDGDPVRVTVDGRNLRLLARQSRDSIRIEIAEEPPDGAVGKPLPQGVTRLQKGGQATLGEGSRTLTVEWVR